MSKIIEKFNEICKKNPNEIAFYYLNKNKLNQKTFREVLDETNAIATALKKQGIKKNDKILAFAEPNYNLCIFMMASFKIGASIMYIDVFAKQDKFKNIFEKYTPKYILVSNKTNLLKPFFKLINQIPNVININHIELSNIKQKDDDVPDSNLALLTTTTGQTGTPKIYLRTQKDLYNQLEVIMNNIEKENTKVVLTTSFMYIFANLLLGFTTIIPNINLRKKEKTINRKLKKFNNLDIDTLITSPDFLIKVNNYFPKLKNIYFGGAILNHNEANLIKNKFSKVNIYYTYGSTECNIISVNKLPDYIKYLEKHHENNLGKIVKGVTVTIGENQEITVSGKNLLTSYIGGNASQQNYNTNDNGYIKNNNLIYLGRTNSNTIINKTKVYYNQIEQEVILNNKQIKKCAFIEKNNQYYLFVQKCKFNKKKVISEIKQKYSITLILKTITKIPCDIKHHTKIDYKRLKRMI